MPIYEFRCKACGKEFETLARLSASEPKSCPACQGPTVRKISVFSAQASSGSHASPPAPTGMCGCGKRAGSCGSQG